MGTRNLTLVIKDGKTKVAQYGQWDGYPEGLGLDILAELRDGGVEKVKQNVDRCKFIDDDDVDRINSEIENGKDLKRDFPLFSRDNAGNVVLSHIKSHNSDDLILLKDSSAFKKNALFCEYCYVVDFDKNTLSVNDHKDLVWSLDSLPSKEEFLSSFKDD